MKLTTKLLTNLANENKGKLREFETVVEDLNNKLLDEKGKQKEIERPQKIRQEIEARAQIRHEEEEAVFSKREREETSMLSLEEKKLEIAATRRVKTKSPELQISMAKLIRHL